MIQIPKKSLVTALMFVFAALAAGCGEKSTPQTSTDGTETQSAVAPSEAFSGEKWNKYVDIYNKQQFDKPNQSAFVEKLNADNLAAVKKGDFTKIPSNYKISGDKSKLENALKMEGRVEGVDETAKVLLDAITEALPVWLELEEYNKARKYEDDNNAKGKELIVKFNENYAKLEEAYANFGAEVAKQDKIQKEKQLEQYKSSGNMFLYHYSMAFAKAESMLDMLGDDAVQSMKNPDTLAKMNAELKLLEEHLDAVKIEIEKAGPNAHFYQSPHGFLLDFVGNYRDARQKPNERNIDRMLQTYNNAVSSLNQMQPYYLPK